MAVDDHSRYAYAEALPDERGVTAAAFLVRALAHFERQGITVERVLTDRILPLSHAADAFRLIAANEVTGKVILDPMAG